MEGKREEKVFEQQNEPVQKSNQTSAPIKVYVRVRPVRGVEVSCVNLVEDDTIELGIQRIFRFDRIYGPISSQVDVYSTAVFPLVCKFFEGINCTIFAYGQTGSGKTYTIGSGCYHGEEREGIIARTVSDIFKCIEGSDSVKRLLSVSYLEIYKEELRDLLQDTSYSANKEIIIREDDSGKTIISGMVEEEVRSVEDALGWLECGNAARVTSATEMNAHSSRSHAVFTISMVQEKTAVYNEHQLNSGLVSKFHFVDLAGSERVSRTNNAGERFKESIHINSGLLALGNVISALSDKRRRSIHVPYRDSKITRILKDSLGGSALTVMITCLSPAHRDLPESLNALKYAKRARNIKNHPVVNVASDGDSGLLYSMKEEIECLRSELHKARETVPPHSATTILTVDSSEFCGPNLFNLKTFRHVLYRQKVIQQAALVVYNQFQSIEPNNVQELRNAMDNLCSIIQCSTEFNGIEDTEFVSKSTNTSLDYDRLESKQNDLDEALLTIDSLRKELHILKRTQSISDQQCVQHSAEQEAMRGQYQCIVKQKAELQDQVGNLERIIDHLQEELQLVQAVEVQDNNPMDDDKVIESLSPPNIADIHSIVHGTVTNLLDLDDSGCDIALRRLTDTLSSRIPETNTGSEQLANGPLPTDGDDVVQSFDNEIDRLNDSIALSQHQLHDADKRLLHAQQTMKSLGLKIRFKEELIKELVKNNSTFQCLNEAYQVKLDSMEQECDQLKCHMQRSSAQLAKGGAITHQVTNNDAVSSNEQNKLSNGRSKRRKAKSAGSIVKGSSVELKDTESKLLTLQRKRQDTLRILKMGERSEKRVCELEGEMERLRNHQSGLKKKLKEELTRKRSLEDQVQQCRVRIMTLSESNRQQSQVIKVKTQEAATAQRKLRNYQPGSHVNHLASQQWIDDEVEKIVEEKQALEAFHNELLEREAVIREQERLLQEKTQLQRQCQGGPSRQIETIDQKIVTKEKLKVSFSGQSLTALEGEITDLKMKREELVEEDTSHKTLSSDQKMSLMEVSEQIEVLETLLQIKNNSANKIKTSQSIELVRSELENVFSKISALPSEESKFLLSVYINKVITLKDKLEKSRTNEAELCKQLTRQEETVHELEQSLDQSHVDKELRLTRLRKEHAKEVQILLEQITATKDEAVCDHNDYDCMAIMKAKVQQLERDLYYYKKTARDLKRQLNSKAAIIPPTVLKDSLDEENT